MKIPKSIKPEEFKKLGILLIILIFSNLCYAIVEPIEYKGIKIKFYDENADKEGLFMILNYVDEEYLQDLNYILVFDIRVQKTGDYDRFSKGIRLYHNWGELTLLHELAHHEQYKNLCSYGFIKDFIETEEDRRFISGFCKPHGQSFCWCFEDILKDYNNSESTEAFNIPYYENVNYKKYC